MMGRNVADYSIVSDGQFIVDVNGSDNREMNVRLRNGALRGLNSILTFVIRDANNLRLRVSIDNRDVFEENIVDGNFERTLQEVFPANVFARGRNEVKFTAVRGSGTFSDIVLWSRRRS
jgi:hypothetical protein